MPPPKPRSTLRFLLEGLEGLILVPLSIVTWPVSRRWLRNWGSRPDERGGEWPGDELLSSRVRSTTRAVTIHSSRHAIWDRVVQLGLGRAGFYSYELLERLAGIPVTNVESVESEWQSLAVGDEVLLHPEVGIRLSKLDRYSHLCFGTRTSRGADTEGASWSIYLRKQGELDYRLVVRGCFGPPSRSGPASRLAGGIEAALDAAMERRMLLTIKRLCEKNMTTAKALSSESCSLTSGKRWWWR